MSQLSVVQPPAETPDLSPARRAYHANFEAARAKEAERAEAHKPVAALTAVIEAAAEAKARLDAVIARDVERTAQWAKTGTSPSPEPSPERERLASELRAAELKAAGAEAALPEFNAKIVVLEQELQEVLRAREGLRLAVLAEVASSIIEQRVRALGQAATLEADLRQAAALLVSKQRDGDPSTVGHAGLALDALQRGYSATEATNAAARQRWKAFYDALAQDPHAAW